MLCYIFTAIKIMWKYARSSTVIKLIEVLVISSMTPLSLVFTQNLINSFEAYFNHGASYPIIILWGGLLIVSMFLISGTGFLSGIQSIHMKRQLDKEFTQDIVSKYRKIDYHCFEDAKIQDTLSRMGNSPQDLILNTFQDGMAALSTIISIIGVILIFMQISWWLPLAFFLLIPIMIWLDFKAMQLMNELFNNQTKNERLLGYFAGLLSDKNSLLELKVFSAVDYIMDLWKAKSKKVLRERLKTTIRAQKYFAVSSVITLLWIGTLVYSLIQGIYDRTVSLGLFVSLIGSVGSLLGMTERLSYAFSNIARHYLQVSHYERFLALPEIPGGTESIQPEENTAVTEIEFCDVHFTYPNTEKEILKGISFKINSRERLAIVGENGAGKTTIIKLLCRLYRPDSGQIKINNIDINDFTEAQLSRYISVVFQDYCRYHLSLRENIALSQIDRKEEDAAIRAALRKGRADSISEDLDVALGKIEESGIDISGGQWQRIAISRALFSESNLVILDEPTASLDPLAESEMYHSFTSLLENKSCIIISHRLASAKMADRIIVLHDGMICETGRHEELIKNASLYSEMWLAQSVWYTGGNHQ